MLHISNHCSLSSVTFEDVFIHFGWKKQIVTSSLFYTVAPEVDLDASVKERMVVHAGGVIRIIAYVSGQPSPEVTWSRDGAALPPEAKVETTAISSSLVIKPCARRHLGVYTLNAKNAGGEKTKNITVEVLGKMFFCVKLRHLKLSNI